MCVNYFAKLALNLISLVIFLLGVAFIVIGSLLLSYPEFLGNLLQTILNASTGDNEIVASDLINFSQVNSTAAGILLGVGCVLFILGVLGFLSACTRSCFIYLYISILTLLTFAEIGAVIFFGTPYAAELMNNEFSKLMFSSLDANFVPENFDVNGNVNYQNGTSTSWMYLQNQYQCCGANDYTDYQNIIWSHTVNFESTGIVIKNASVPPSCCQMKIQNMIAINEDDYSNVISCLVNSPVYVNQKGCAEEIMSSISQSAKIPILILSSAAIIQLFCMTITIIICAKGNKSSKLSPNDI